MPHHFSPLLEYFVCFLFSYISYAASFVRKIYAFECGATVSFVKDQRTAVRKFHAYERSEVPKIRNFCCVQNILDFCDKQPTTLAMPAFQQDYPGTVASLRSALPCVLHHISPADAFLLADSVWPSSSLESRAENVYFLQLCQIISLYYWNISYAFYFRLFRRPTRRLSSKILLCVRMRCACDRFLRIKDQRAIVRKLYAYERSEVPNIRKFYCVRNILDLQYVTNSHIWTKCVFSTAVPGRFVLLLLKTSGRSHTIPVLLSSDKKAKVRFGFSACPFRCHDFAHRDRLTVCRQNFKLWLLGTGVLCVTIWLQSS